LEGDGEIHQDYLCDEANAKGEDHFKEIGQFGDELA
jgi:hypothetical protein